MPEPFFAGPRELLLGALTGLVFGFLLQKGGVTRYEVIVGQFLLRDFTVARVMLTSIVIGGIGVYVMLGMGWIDGLHVKATQALANALGGVIFGFGMALLGYCPGTGVAAIGDGARDAIFGVAGMVAGAALYAEVHPTLADGLLTVGAGGKDTLATVTGVSPFVLLLVLALVLLPLLGRPGASRTAR